MSNTPGIWDAQREHLLGLLTVDRSCRCSVTASITLPVFQSQWISKGHAALTGRVKCTVQSFSKNQSSGFIRGFWRRDSRPDCRWEWILSTGGTLFIEPTMGFPLKLSGALFKSGIERIIESGFAMMKMIL